MIEKICEIYNLEYKEYWYGFYFFGDYKDLWLFKFHFEFKEDIKKDIFKKPYLYFNLTKSFYKEGFYE